ncbi:MAG: Glycine betaine/carnitine/choline transport system permease protein OpuCB [Dehalococcoidia bacterium]|nr:Glycine betaine/carnitine/choline transport system permease protein OpuCB [Bacillota bacterium]MBT9143308.1 Glycine betaine/carnitine/choline transport system permease protein OpuCB [Bacillota bacterium]
MRRQVVLVSLIALCIGLTVWVTSMDRVGIMFPFTWEGMAKHAQRHLQLVFVAEIIAIAIGVPLGVLVTRPGFKKLAIPIIGGASAGQSVPSMAIVAIMVPLIGLGFRPAMVALIIWGVLPILRNSYAAINDINPAIIEAARGMGMTRGQIVRKIELPLALPVIMTGIRVSTVVLVGSATLAALVAGGGLGEIILVGVFVGEPLIILQGGAPAAAMAITMGFILERIERWMTPRGLRVKAEIS